MRRVRPAAFILTSYMIDLPSPISMGMHLGVARKPRGPDVEVSLAANFYHIFQESRLAAVRKPCGDRRSSSGFGERGASMPICCGYPQHVAEFSLWSPMSGVTGLRRGNAETAGSLGLTAENCSKSSARSGDSREIHSGSESDCLGPNPGTLRPALTSLRPVDVWPQPDLQECLVWDGI